MADGQDTPTTPPPAGDITKLDIQTEMKNCYLDYAMSVIVGRALPDVRDGLKPVHRRALFSMHNLKNFHDRPFLKSARVVGDVIGKYHPHGDSAVYGTIVRLAQEFSMRYPLINGQGNFGSIDGDGAAAMRYTEVRMHKMAEEMLQDLDKDTIDWAPNYDESLKEPRVLPTRIPNLLINGSAGIAVGMATNIPPHNLSEVMAALLALLDNREMSIDELINLVPGPDFPTGGIIHGIEGIRAAYHTGRGVLQMRAKYEIEQVKDKERIVITEIPYQVNKAKLIEDIAHLVHEKVVTGVADLRDESNRLGIRIVIDLKRGEMGQVVMNQLLKHTQLQTSFGIILLAIVNGGPKVMNLKDMLLAFLDHRREVVIRRTVFELKKAQAKAHILEGLKTAVEHLDPIINLIKKSPGPQEAKQGLTTQYKLSEAQAQAILDLKLQRLTGLERDKIIQDYNDTMKEIARLEAILHDESLVRQIIREEFQEIVNNYGDERRTQIIPAENEIRITDLIKSEDVIVTITHRGYIKRMALDTFRTQRRGGMGVKGGETNKGDAETGDDFYTNIFIANTHATMLFFTNKGQVYARKVYEIPEGQRTSKGRNLVNLVQIPAGEVVKEIMAIRPEEFTEDRYLLFGTERGIVKKSSLSEYRRLGTTALRAIKIQEGDALLAVRLLSGSKDVFLCSSAGKVIRFAESDCRPQGRVSQGVRGMEVDASEKVIGMELVDDDVAILSITANGYGKRTMASQYRQQSRGGKGIITIKQTDRNGDIVQIKPVAETDDLMIITDKGQVMRLKVAEVSLLGRNTQGVRIIRLRENERVVAVEKIVDPNASSDANASSSTSSPTSSDDSSPEA
jgi:DNA gyrase subunit A